MPPEVRIKHFGFYLCLALIVFVGVAVDGGRKGLAVCRPNYDASLVKDDACYDGRDFAVINWASYQSLPFPFHKP